MGFKSSRGNCLSTPITNTRGRWIAVNRYIPLPTGLGFLISAPVTTLPPFEVCLQRGGLLSKSDSELLSMTINGNSIGYCRIRLGGPNAFCSYYVVAKPSPTTGHQGWPRNVDDRGTGCVNDPGAPCVFTLDQYRNWPLPDREAMCASQDVLTNAVAQLRHAIAKCACGGITLAPSAVPSPAPAVTKGHAGHLSPFG